MRARIFAWAIVASAGWALALGSLSLAQKADPKSPTAPQLPVAMILPEKPAKFYKLKLEWVQANGNDKSVVSLDLIVSQVSPTRSREHATSGENRMIFHDFDAQLFPRDVKESGLLLNLNGEYQVLDSNSYRTHEISGMFPIALGATTPLRVITKPTSTAARESMLMATLSEM